MTSPYISFVVWARNDDYVREQLRRQQTSLETLLEQMERHKLESEIVIVEWNPPADRQRLKDALFFPEQSTAVSVRVVTVEPQYHQNYKYCDKRGIHSSVAINVGIRRARGRFVLPRAQDVFYSEALAGFLAEKSLSGDCVYRADRYDVDPIVVEAGKTATDHLLEQCEKHLLLRHDSEWSADLPGVPRLHMGSPGDFLLMAAEKWHTIRGLHESPDVCSLDDDILALHAAHAAGLHQVVLSPECRVYKLAHGSTSKIRLSPVYSSLLRRVRDIARKTVPKRTRHRFCLLFNVPKRQVEGLDGVLFDSFERAFLPIARKWAKGIGPFHLNSENWGLAESNLADSTLCRAQWEA